MCSNNLLYTITKPKQHDETYRNPNYCGIRTVWVVFGWIMSLIVLIAIIAMGKTLTDIRNLRKELLKKQSLDLKDDKSSVISESKSLSEDNHLQENKNNETKVLN